MTDSSKSTENQIDGDTDKEVVEDAMKSSDENPQPEPETPVEEAESEPSDDAELPEVEGEELPENPAEDIVAPAPAPEAKRSGGFVGPVFGGVIAAVIGFGASQYLGPLGLFGAGTEDARVDELVLKNDEVAQTIADLKATVAAQVPVDVTPQLDALGAVSEDLGIQIETLAQALTDLDTRITEIEKRPVSGGDISGAAAAYERELEAMRNEMALQRERNDELMAQVGDAANAATAEIGAATANARTIEAQASVMRIMAALEAGTPFATALPALDGYEVAPVLSENAADGIVSLPQLQASYAEPARVALSAALKANPGDSTGDRISAFLRAQTGARSLSPRDGDDPDAILSRTEAAVANGALADALTEISTLPPEAQQAMSGWVAQAQARIDALAAAEALSTIVNAN